MCTPKGIAFLYTPFWYWLKRRNRYPRYIFPGEDVEYWSGCLRKNVTDDLNKRARRIQWFGAWKRYTIRGSSGWRDYRRKKDVPKGIVWMNKYFLFKYSSFPAFSQLLRQFLSILCSFRYLALFRKTFTIVNQFSLINFPLIFVQFISFVSAERCNVSPIKENGVRKFSLELKYQHWIFQTFLISIYLGETAELRPDTNHLITLG